MTDLTPDARAILDAGRDLDSAGDLEKARVRRALFAKIAAGGAVLTAASSAAADGGVSASGAVASSATASGAVGTAAGGGVAAGGTIALAKILIPLAVIVGGGAGGFVAWRAQRALAPTAPVAPAPVVAPVVQPVPAPALAPPAPTLAPAPEPAARIAPAHHARVAAPSHIDAPVPANRLAEETALLASANAELRSGDARRALSLLDDYDHRYPAGVLREEVLATRVIARCQLGPSAGKIARRGAAAFLARHPASPLAPRVRSSCGE
jgi:hypothetical protein